MTYYRSTRPTAVYRMYDDAGSLLYVGCSTDLARRLHQHQWATKWIGDVAVVKVQHHRTVEGARAAEQLAISQEEPRYNIQHNHGRSTYEIPSELAKRVDARAKREGRFA